MLGRPRPVRPETSAPIDSIQGLFSVTIHKATNIITKSPTEKNEPYCRINLIDNNSKPLVKWITKRERGTLNPTWEETFTSHVQSPIPLLLDITCYSGSTSTPMDELIGRQRIQIGSSFKFGVLLSEDLKLPGKAELRAKIHFTVNYKSDKTDKPSVKGRPTSHWVTPKK